VREAAQGKGHRDRDRGTRVLIVIALGAALAAAPWARSVAPAMRMPIVLRVAGVVAMWLGLALRVWAIAALGGSFRTTVEVVNNSDTVPDATATFRVTASSWVDVNERFTMLGQRAQERMLELLQREYGRGMASGGVEVYPADAAAAGPDAYEEAAI
ncbi:MAG TPA: hypothetical protein VE570_07980, partial [Thermoleophilaceae bacterium]|nr:hypothetical protein [Thermoleophilaceae bacterium]